MYSIVILPKANQDILNAINWYSQEAGITISVKFKKSILLTVEKLQNDFVTYAATYRSLSRIFIKHFPYTIYFMKYFDKKLIVIYAVLHNKQSTSTLAKRV